MELSSLVLDATNLSPVSEGKTKVIFKIKGNDALVLIRSKDQLTAFNALRQDKLTGKALIANKTTVNVFRLLNDAGVPTHFVVETSDTDFIAKRCEMVPIEWVARRVATGSFLKRNFGVPEGYRFAEPKIETFFKDDEKDDPEYSDEQIECAGFELGGRKIGKPEIRFMKRLTSLIFKVLERCWCMHQCTLVDLKVEYGVTTEGEIVLADVIDNDSWRIWPNGDRHLQLDKQFYRDLSVVTQEAMEQVLSNYEKVMEMTEKFLAVPRCRALIIMGSSSDSGHCDKIANSCRSLGILPSFRVSSAHKTTLETLEIVVEYECDVTPTVVIAAAGRSNGLGPIIAGNSVLPVINCPPLADANLITDLWSSLRMPSGIGCSTVLGAEEGALCAAKILALHDHMVFARILVKQLQNAVRVSEADINSSSSGPQEHH